jgi:hypothetical protein
VNGRDYNTTTNQYVDREETMASWSGDAGACLYGPAIETQSLTSAGFPMPDIYYVKGEGKNDVYKPSSPIQKLASNVYLANYFDPADHNSPFVGYPGALNITHRYYELRCLDRAHELKARIRVQIRDWNTYAEWEKGSTGDPEFTGTEPNFPDFGYNDLFDWADYVFSGVDFYPQLEKN